MWKIRTHRLGIDQGSLMLFSDYKHNGTMWTGEGARELRQRVDFGEPFLQAPAVNVGMSMWDVDHSTNQRMDISAENVETSGFDLVFRTWGDSHVARVRADWIALGEVRHEDDWDSLL
ncbi:H-type lectin domain-containing protein [Maritimibacter sp. HL-12]|uniref:H-type lectin domain-containing protein n=1 Tax=Maritimibacter sp. HL-12 TaxID=1162418 RepID=UPI000A0F2103|nr:H-type lectin domain-containing protein [Maritimibacter sp. HL-12]SMH36987.1 H-type lectin domain-containing protein [Maritimibacter sp. HL-12]